MNILKLYKLIKQNQKLANKRHPMFEKNKAMKVFGWIFILFWAAYLLIFGIMFGSMCSNHPTYNFINGGLLVFLIIDFYSRFMMTDTPAQEVKPYKILPISQKSLIKIFLVRIGLSPFNAFWLCFFVPFALFSILLSSTYGFGNFVVYLVMIWLLFVLNGYWYLFWRSLMNHKMLWIIAPTLIYAALVWFGLWSNDWLFQWCKHTVHDAICYDVMPFIYVIAAIFVMFLINLYFQNKFIYFEIAKVEKVSKVKPREMSFLNRFGILGEYLKLEVKSIQRNKTVRKQFWSGFIAMLMISLLFAFTDAYDSMPFWRSFICMYCFAALGVINLTSILCPEGNYIDCLMVRKESILTLLKAKYYFNLGMMIIPMLIIIMPISQGKTTIIEALACMAFAAGVIMPFLFQLAVYNNNTLKLNDVLTKSGQNNKSQIICSLAAMFVPIIIMYVLINLCGTYIGSTIMLVIGIVGIALHHRWLDNIYRRFMKRRHENMANFRATR